MIKKKFIKISPEFHAALVSHGRFGERFEDIILRLIGNKIKIPTSDRAIEVDSKDDVDSKKTQKKRRKGK